VEENTLFPYLLTLDLDQTPTSIPVETFKNAIQWAITEHKDIVGILFKISEITNNFCPPSGAHHSLTNLYLALRRLTEDLVQHFYLENHYVLKLAFKKEQSESPPKH
jgi:iron-sulfur cluster repair protein YtfE (RIC family)